MFRLTGMVMGLILALLTCEILLRVFDIQPAYNVVSRNLYRFSDNPTLGYELKPGAIDDDTIISPEGFRDRSFLPRKAKHIFRIVAVGDSITFGLFCQQDKTYAKILEQQLNERATDGSTVFEVINMGVTGYNTTQVVEMLQDRGMRYEPDLVLYGYCLNDPQSFSLEAESLRALKDTAQAQLTETLSHGIHRWLAASRLWRIIVDRCLPPPKSFRKQLVDPPYAALRAGKPIEYIRDIHNNPDTWQRVTEGLTRLHAITTGHKSIPVVVAIFPVSTDDGFDNYPAADVHQKVVDEVTAHGFHAIDLTAAFKEASHETRDHLYQEMLHPNQRGHAVAGKAMCQWLLASGLLARPQKEEG